MRKTYFNSIDLVYLIVIVTMLVSFSTKTFAQCDAQIIQALRSNYQGVTTQVIKDYLFEASCKFNQNSRNTGLNVVNPKYGSLTYDDNRMSLSEACYTRESDYFSNYSNNTLYSFLPKESVTLIERCFGGLSLTARKEGGSKVVTIRAAYYPRDDSVDAIVERFTIFPSNALTCDYLLKPDDKINAGGVELNCLVNSDADSKTDISITLNTKNKGAAKPVLIRREAVIKSVFGWNLAKTDNSYKCQDAESNLYNPELLMSSSGNNDIIAVGDCVRRIGKGYVKIDDKKFFQKDSWTIKTYKGKPYFHCQINGEIIGDLVNCRNLPGKCKNSDYYLNYCAGFYGNRQGN